ncbi:MAG: O-linked N-acetylglucosamine transferase, SPINDLY family protein, partial [Planktothrix sp.]
HPLAIKFTEQGLKFDPKHPELWRCLSTFYQDIGEYAKGIEVAKHCYLVMDNFPDQVYATFLLLRGLMSAGGRWTEFCTTIENYQLMLNRLLEEKPTLAYDLAVRSFSTTFFFPYYQDQPRENLLLRRQVSEFIQSNIETQNTEIVKSCRGWKSRSKKNILAEKCLKIGYVSHCLRNHSVGWLARGLFQHHDHDKF